MFITGHYLEFNEAVEKLTMCPTRGERKSNSAAGMTRRWQFGAEEPFLSAMEGPCQIAHFPPLVMCEHALLSLRARTEKEGI